MGDDREAGSRSHCRSCTTRRSRTCSIRIRNSRDESCRTRKYAAGGVEPGNIGCCRRSEELKEQELVSSSSSRWSSNRS